MYAVEINDKKSFVNTEEKDYFNNFFKQNDAERKRIFIDDFSTIDNKKITEITFFPIGKKVKEIDVIMFSPYKLGIDFMVSDKFIKIIENFNLPVFNKIPVKIDSFEKNIIY